MNKLTLTIIALSSFIVSANAASITDDPIVAEKIKTYCEIFKPQGENGKSISAAVAEGKLREKGWANLDDVLGCLTGELEKEKDSPDRQEHAKALLEIAELQSANHHRGGKPFVLELTKMTK